MMLLNLFSIIISLMLNVLFAILKIFNIWNLKYLEDILIVVKY